MDTKVWLVLVLFLAVCLGAGGLGSLFTASSVRDWYPRLCKPPGTPPNWVFGPVWTALYLLMAVSAWLVWREYGRGALPALLIFFAQLALNVAWPGIFFGSRMPGVAFLEIVLLWLAIACTMLVFYLLRPWAALLLVPYLMWVSYAAYLNLGIWRLNRR
ncbi:MAG TPA: TspO/MBR family protein [Terriglobales bacterium]|nr:TspO/MBR family protein [Terriglobales bacterium]